jgi:hypothetical protein
MRPESDIRRKGRYEPDELVVALPHLREVSTALGNLPLAYSVKDRSAALGLALIRLVGLPAAAATLRRDHELVRAAQFTQPPTPGSEAGESPTDLDLLLSALRRGFARAYDGWVPTMGKNRHVESVVGLPHVSGGGVAYPQPCDHGSTVQVPPRLGLGVSVGLIDTQLYPHDALAGRYIVEPGSALKEQQPYPHWAGHGTFVAGLILAQAPAAALDVRWVLNNEHAIATAWQLATRMVEFLSTNVQILNLSLGCYTEDGAPPLLLQRAVELVAPRILTVAAAGNHGGARDEAASGRRPYVTPKSPVWPAAFPDVVAVGADREPFTPASFTPVGVPWLNLMAPGEDVVSTYLKGEVRIEESNERVSGIVGSAPTGEKTTFTGYAEWSGTSFATATVSGQLAALTVPGRHDVREALHRIERFGPDETIHGVRPWRPAQPNGYGSTSSSAR